jgi:hypothetical protein
VLLSIVQDEARHGALAWRTVAWASSTHPELVDVRQWFLIFHTLSPQMLRSVVEEKTSTRADQTAIERTLFARLVRPLAHALIGVVDWRTAIAREDVEISVVDASLLEAAIAAMLTTFGLQESK